MTAAGLAADAINPFRTFWDLGYHRLVPVVPIGAPLAEKSALSRRLAHGDDSRGKAPGVRRPDGNWTGFNFVAMEARESNLDTWASWGASVGIKTGEGLIAVDIDTRDRAAAETLYKLAAQHLGPAHVRFGQKPKCLLLYDAPQDTTYQWVRFTTPTEEKPAKVEILAEGRQFVAHGIHPKTGAPYAWPHGVPRREQLTRITATQLQAFLAAARAALPDAQSGTSSANEAPDQDGLRAPSWDDLVRTVEAIPNTSALFPSRDDYLKVAYAIKASTPDDVHESEALNLYLDWCERWAEGHNDPEIAMADWDRAKPPFRVGFDFLRTHAPGLFFRAEEAPADDMFAANAQATGETQGPSFFELLRIGDIFSLPDPKFAIDRHLPEMGLGFLYGRPGCGKSFAALDWALHMAYGLPDWHGDAIINRPNANVLYLAREGSTGFKARIRAWQESRFLPDGVAPRFQLIRQTINFMQPEDIQKLMRTVRHGIDGPVDMIVVDTVSRVLPGADENLQKEMTLFVKACDALQDAFGGIVLGVHHAGKSGDMRGSSVLKGAGDFVFKLERKEGAKTGTLYCEKQKDGPDGWGERYEFRKVEFEGGSSLVPFRTTQAAAEEVCDEDRAESILAALQAAWDAGTPWSPHAQSKTRYAPRVISAEFDVPAEVAAQWIAIWLDDGSIVEDLRDPKRHVRGYRRVSSVSTLTVDTESLYG